MLNRLDSRDEPIEPYWLQVISDMLHNNFPHASLVGFSAYGAYEYVTQALDLAILQHSQAMYELDLLSPDTNALVLRTLQRYNMDKPSSQATIKLDAMTATSQTPKAIAAKLSKALTEAATVASASQTNSTGDGTANSTGQASEQPKLSIAQRIAAIKAAKGL
jgi:hypothetical protein